MLETLWLKEETRKRYFNVFLLSILFGFIAVWITYKFLNFHQGLISVFMISLASAYPLISYLKRGEYEESKLIKKYSEKSLLKRHGRELGIYLSFFFGIVIVFIISTTLLPSNFFTIQKETLNLILSGSATQNSFFNAIFSNNLRVFFLTFLLSFFISAGMIFVLVWNASILGVFLAIYSKGLQNIPKFSLGYLPHGILEISAYIFAGISGALLSYQIGHLNKKKYRKEVFPRIFKDAVVLLALGIFLIFLGALIESFM